MISALNKKEDGTLELTITIPQKKVKAAYQKALNALAKKAEIKGFRKGKAPAKLVEEKLGKNQIYEEVLKTLVPEAYLEAVKERKLKPVVNPQIKVTALDEKKDWQFTAVTCEAPKVVLGKYREEVKKALAPDKIWTPDKGDPKKSQTGKNGKDDQATQDQKLQKILDILLKTVKIQIPAILVEQEVERMLSRLIDQTGRLGLTVEKYLESQGKTSEQLRAEYRKQAEQTLKLEFILAAIADKEKIGVKNEEIAKMIEAVPDEKTKKSMETPAQKAYLRQLLRKRAVIDKLLKL